MDKLTGKPFVNYFMLSVVCFLLFVVQYTDGLMIKINGCTALLPVSAVFCISVYFREWKGAIMGLFVGILMDTVSSGSLIFNSLTLLLLGCFTGLVATCYFNRNIFSGIILCLAFSFVYFLIKWLVFAVIPGYFSLSVLLISYLPQAVYTAISNFILYLVFGFVIKKIQLKRE
ncbi:MAG: rod shape-determining protein MreD [bacterium]|nr:rod shape-determining protein MreD [bacterium]